MPEIFPFKPNWSEAPEVTLSYKTDIFTSRSGLEQRRALRSTPRRRVDYTSLAHQSDMVAFNRLLATKQNADFVFPDWTLPAVATHGIVSGATFFSLREIAPDWATAGRAAFLQDGDTLTPVTIESVDAYTVELSAPVAADHSNTMLLRPAYLGLLATARSVLNTSNTITVSVSYDVTPGSVPNSTNTFFPYVVDGQEVFAFPWNWGEAVSAEFSWNVENVDFDRGVIVTHRPVDFGKVGQSVTVVRHGDVQIDHMQRFIERQKGQRGQFWMPSGTADMVVTADISDGATSFTVAGTSVANDFGASKVYKGVALYLRDGRKVFRKINGIISSGGNSVVSLSAGFTFAIPVSLIAKVSWMRPSRFTSDEVSLEYLTSSTVQWKPSTNTVTYATDAQDYTALDGAGNWTMDNWGEETEVLLNSIDYMMNVVLPFGSVPALPLGAFDDLINNEFWGPLG